MGTKAVGDCAITRNWPRGDPYESIDPKAIRIHRPLSNEDCDEVRHPRHYPFQHPMKVLFNRIVLLSLLSSSPALAQTTWFVDAAGTAPGTGTPSDPYTRVDFAVAQATTVSGDLVFVEPGIYQDEAIDFLGKDLHVFSRGPL